MDLFDRNGVWPAVRKATIEYRAPAFARDLLRVETTVAGRGTTSMTLRHVGRRVSDDATVAEADIVFVCIDRLGRATPIPEEIARFLGPRTPVGGGHQPIRVPVGDGELAVDVRGEGVPVLFVHGFPFDRTVWRHQLAALSRVRRIAPDLRGVGGSGVPPGADGYSLTRYADDLAAVLDALGVRQAVVCGLRTGGYVTFKLLRRHPPRPHAPVPARPTPLAHCAPGTAPRDQPVAGRLPERASLKCEPRGEGPGALVTIPCAVACRAGSRSETRPGSWRCRTSTAEACLPPGKSR